MATTGWTVIGTDTGVGKTVVAAAIAANFVAQGRRVAVAKTVQTGGQDDTAEVERLVGEGVGRRGWQLSRPLDPGLAAELGGDHLFPGELVSWTLTALTGVDVGIVDTNGGCASEMKEGFNNSDLALAVGLSAVVVCSPRQGTLSHALLTCDHLRARHVDITGLVVDRMPRNPTIVDAANMAELERLTRYPIVGVLPEMTLDPSSFAAITTEWLGPQLGGRFEKAEFLERMRALV